MADDDAIASRGKIASWMGFRRRSCEVRPPLARGRRKTTRREQRPKARRNRRNGRLRRSPEIMKGCLSRIRSDPRFWSDPRRWYPHSPSLAHSDKLARWRFFVVAQFKARVTFTRSHSCWQSSSTLHLDRARCLAKRI